MLILHYNVHQRVAQPIIDVSIDYTWETLHHPTFSLDLSLPDFNFFPKLKEPLRGTCFAS